MATIVSCEASPAIGQVMPLIVKVFLETSTATAIEYFSSTGLTCLPCWITSTVPQHDNNTSSACTLLAAIRHKANAMVVVPFILRAFWHTPNAHIARISTCETIGL